MFDIKTYFYVICIESYCTGVLYPHLFLHRIVNRTENK